MILKVLARVLVMEKLALLFVIKCLHISSFDYQTNATTLDDAANLWLRPTH
ncbi:MAG: hypothetical protein ACI80S_000604 [Pseudohongiellaceae bacterium]|jgi:hypothetical protein